MRRFTLLVLAAVLVSVVSAAAAAHARELEVVVSILPQAFFVERVGGEQVKVQVLVGPGQSPATYEPTPKQLANLRSADLYIRIGVPFEQALARKIVALAPDLPVVDGAEGVELQPMTRADHDHDGGHSHGGLDPHFWLDPLLAKIHAATLCDALCRLDPARAPGFRRNLGLLDADLEALHARLEARLAGLEGRVMYVFHPAYGYLARRYGLEQAAVEIEGKEPSARQLAQLVEEARKSQVSALFFQPQFSGRSARVIADAIGADVIPLDPLARDYIDNMNRMADLIATGCGAAGHEPRD